jgi:hypothetical protein
MVKLALVSAGFTIRNGRAYALQLLLMRMVCLGLGYKPLIRVTKSATYGPQGRRAAGPQGRRAAGPQGRRAAGRAQGVEIEIEIEIERPERCAQGVEIEIEIEIEIERPERCAQGVEIERPALLAAPACRRAARLLSVAFSVTSSMFQNAAGDGPA